MKKKIYSVQVWVGNDVGSLSGEQVYEFSVNPVKLICMKLRSKSEGVWREASLSKKERSEWEGDMADYIFRRSAEPGFLGASSVNATWCVPEFSDEDNKAIMRQWVLEET